MIQKSLRTASALLLIFASTNAKAQHSGSQHRRIDVRVPFAFTVGETRFPAGTIAFFQMSSPDRLRVRSAQANTETTVLLNRLSNPTASKETRVIFNRYGDQYFLSQLWIMGYKDGANLRKSKAEAELEEKGERPKQVVLAAK